MAFQKSINLISWVRSWELLLFFFFCFVSGTHFHWCLLGQVCGQPRLKAGLPDRDLLAKLRWALHWHHPSHYQPLHSDGAERWTLITEDISLMDCLISQKQWFLVMSMEEDVKEDTLSVACLFLDNLKQEIPPLAGKSCNCILVWHSAFILIIVSVTPHVWS